MDIAYILTGQSSTDRLTQQMADTLHVANDSASIPVHQAFLAAGYSAHNDTETIIGHLAFRRNWLARMGVHIKTARIARVRGDSMAPTRQDDDIVLINGSDEAKNVPVRRRGPEDRRLPPIHAVNTEDGPRIKRLECPERAGCAFCQIVMNSRSKT